MHREKFNGVLASGNPIGHNRMAFHFNEVMLHSARRGHAVLHEESENTAVTARNRKKVGTMIRNNGKRHNGDGSRDWMPQSLLTNSRETVSRRTFAVSPLTVKYAIHQQRTAPVASQCCMTIEIRIEIAFQ